MLADIAVDQSRVDEATILLRSAADVDPSTPRFLALIGRLQASAGVEATLKVIDTIPEPFRSEFDIRAAEAVALGFLGMHQRQLEIYEELTKVAPKDASLWRTSGDVLKTVGRMDDAVSALRQAIRCRPSYGEAYWTLANFKAFKFSDSDITAMRKALKKGLAYDDALHFEFALGKALEDRTLYQQSFRHYAAGNAMRAARIHPADMFATRAVDVSYFDIYSRFFCRTCELGQPRIQPIFVVGLHRSGSTLIEQILATHPLIEGTT